MAILTLRLARLNSNLLSGPLLPSESSAFFPSQIKPIPFILTFHCPWVSFFKYVRQEPGKKSAVSWACWWRRIWLCWLWPRELMLAGIFLLWWAFLASEACDLCGPYLWLKTENLVSSWTPVSVTALDRLLITWVIPPHLIFQLVSVHLLLR